MRDREGVYGKAFCAMLAQLGMRERRMGSIRRELLDHVIVLNERHLTRLLSSYSMYYNAPRTPLSLEKDAPRGRAVMGPSEGEVVAAPQVGELRHR